ncbi:MAG: alpha/beta hydrolase [Bacteroidota bacterium]
MNTIRRIPIFIYLLLLIFNARVQAQTLDVTTDSLNLFDSSRNRSIPVTLYLPNANKKTAHEKLIIFSHGYNANKPGASKKYSYITENLAAWGYFVASIQHELPTDSLLSTTGIPQIVRRTNWERGVENILFVLTELKKSNPALDYKHVILMGHSNGGDMIMLFAQKYPELVDKVISLDNRRVTIPRTNQPKLYSIRSSDQPADDGVLPTQEEQEKYKIEIVKLPNTIHNDMGNNANDAQRKEINGYIMGFLKKAWGD